MRKTVLVLVFLTGISGSAFSMTSSRGHAVPVRPVRALLYPGFHEVLRPKLITDALKISQPPNNHRVSPALLANTMDPSSSEKEDSGFVTRWILPVGVTIGAGFAMYTIYSVRGR